MIRHFRIGYKVTVRAGCIREGESGVVVALSHESVRDMVPRLVRFGDGKELGYADSELEDWTVPKRHRALSYGRLAP